MCPESKAQSEGAGSAVPVVSRATQLLIEERQKLAGTRQCGPEGGGGGLGQQEEHLFVFRFWQPFSSLQGVISRLSSQPAS